MLFCRLSTDGPPMPIPHAHGVTTKMHSACDMISTNDNAPARNINSAIFGISFTKTARRWLSGNWICPPSYHSSSASTFSSNEVASSEPSR
jgi:hypothetical protein